MCLLLCRGRLPGWIPPGPHSLLPLGGLRSVNCYACLGFLAPRDGVAIPSPMPHACCASTASIRRSRSATEDSPTLIRSIRALTSFLTTVSSLRWVASSILIMAAMSIFRGEGRSSTLSSVSACSVRGCCCEPCVLGWNTAGVSEKVPEMSDTTGEAEGSVSLFPHGRGSGICHLGGWGGFLCLREVPSHSLAAVFGHFSCFPYPSISSMSTCRV